MDHGCYKRMRHGSISRAASPPAREDEGGGWDEAVEDDCLEQEQEQAQARQEDAAAAATGLARVQVSLVFVVGGPGAGSHWIASTTHASCTTTLEA
jgi:hypothetical protein